MISDGLENCVQYCHNFNPDKSKNPFAYFTQIIYYAFLRRIEKEKKQSYIKQKVTCQSGVLSELATMDDHDLKQYNLTVSLDDVVNNIDDYEQKMERKRNIRKSKNKNSLENFMG